VIVEVALALLVHQLPLVDLFLLVAQLRESAEGCDGASLGRRTVHAERDAGINGH